MISACFPEPHHSVDLHVLSTSVQFNGSMGRENKKDFIVVETEKALQQELQREYLVVYHWLWFNSQWNNYICSSR